MTNQNNYQAFLLDDKLKSFAKTEKEIAPTLENINILNDEEYINLMLYFVKMLYESIIPIRITGACYLKLIYEYDVQRFTANIFNCIHNSSFSINSWDDYTDLDCALIFCYFELYKKFLSMMSLSENQEIIEDVNDSLSDTLDDYQNSRWYNSYMTEYKEFKRKLSIE